MLIYWNISYKNKINNNDYNELFYININSNDVIEILCIKIKLIILTILKYHI